MNQIDIRTHSDTQYALRSPTAYAEACFFRHLQALFYDSLYYVVYSIEACTYGNVRMYRNISIEASL